MDGKSKHPYTICGPQRFATSRSQRSSARTRIVGTPGPRGPVDPAHGRPVSRWLSGARAAEPAQAGGVPVPADRPGGRRACDRVPWCGIAPLRPRSAAAREGIHDQHAPLPAAGPPAPPATARLRHAVAALTRIFIEEIERLLRTAAVLSCDGDRPCPARPRLGAVSFLHRFGSAINHHVHLHACATDGVFVPTGDGPPAFLPARLITQADLATLTEKVRRRVVRWFRMQRLLDADVAADMLRWENSGFSVDARTGLHSSTATCRAIFRASSTCCDTVPGRPSRWSGSP